MLKKGLLVSIVFLSIMMLSFHHISPSFKNFRLSESSFVLSIPKLKLEEEFFPTDQEKNNLDYGIQTIYPTDKKKDFENFLLASHSGNGKHSYFNQLELLEIKDVIVIKHYGLEKQYFVQEIGYKEKDGVLNLANGYDHFIILITCSHIRKDMQVYYIATANY